MHNRKVIKFGKTSFVVSLPIEWLRENNIDKGDHLDMIETKSGLILSPTHKKPILKEHSIIISDEVDRNTLYNKLKSAYISNNDIIKIQGENITKHQNLISDLIKELKALEIVGINDKEIIIKDYADKDSTEISDAVLKSNIHITKMFELLLNNIKKKDSDSTLNEIISTDNEINKNNNFALKLVNYKSNRICKDNEKLLILAKISMYLELVGDELKRIAKVKMNEVHDSSKDIQKVYHYYKRSFDTSYKFLHKGFDDIETLVKLKDKLEKELEDTIDLTNDKNKSIILHKLKNITDFMHIVLMSAHVYKLM